MGSAHDRHFPLAILGREAQQSAQHDAVRFRHGSSRSQTTQAACRTIRAVSRPSSDSVCNMALIVFRREMRIVTAMKKTLILLALFAFSALPAAAQHNEFGFLFGSTKPKKSPTGKGDFDSGMREIYYAMQLEPATLFRIEVGRMSTTTSLPTGVDAAGVRTFETDQSGTLEHADGIIEYRFSEPYGYTGLFAGAGMYRQKTNAREETDYGFQGGISALFPLNRTYAIAVEGAYHWVNVYSPRPRYVTLGAGIRIAF
jgi:hypothetical protein